MAPADGALAAVGEHWPVLVEEVVDALVVDRTVGVVDPAFGRREVVARPVRVVGQHPAPQLPRRRAEHLPLPAGHGHAEVAHLARPRRAVHSRYLPMMSMIRPMSSRADASGVRFSVPSTMHSWKWRSSRRKALSQSTAGSVR